MLRHARSGERIADLVLECIARPTADAKQVAVVSAQKDRQLRKGFEFASGLRDRTSLQRNPELGVQRRHQFFE